jgi:nitroimidazol reductase NimA-like FMN-containing flavoprotein (pyridoxamine 5'-phosphate oxidase superfamily)
MRRSDREINDRELIDSLIRECDVCRLAFAAADVPYIVTMNFGFSAGDKRVLWFHCAPEGRKLDLMAKNNRVCFEMDTAHELTKGPEACDWGMNFKSVVGYGKLYIVEDEAERQHGLACLMEHYGWQGNPVFGEKILKRTKVLRLDIDEISAKVKS